MYLNLTSLILTASNPPRLSFNSTSTLQCYCNLPLHLPRSWQPFLAPTPKSLKPQI